MANPAPPRPGIALIADRYAVEMGRPLPPVGGLPACVATDQATGRTDLMAIRVQRHLPPRARMLQALAVPLDGLLTPLAHGVAAAQPGSAEEAGYVICLAPPGPSLLARTHPWSARNSRHRFRLEIGAKFSEYFGSGVSSPERRMFSTLGHSHRKAGLLLLGFPMGTRKTTQ